MRRIALLAMVLCGLTATAAAAPLNLEILHVTRDEEAPIPFSFMEPVPEGEGVDGARLGLADNNATGRFTGASGTLREVVVPRDAAVQDTPDLAGLLAAGPQVVVADLALADLQALLALPGTADDIIVNARATDDVLRREGCQANLFHTAVSRAMKADGLAQYLVLMGWKRWFLLVGPSPADEGFAAAIRHSATRFGARVTVVPASTTAEDVLALNPDGVFLSNGPGDPEPLQFQAAQVRNLIGRKPVFGICLGHQIIGLALGGKTYKLKFGHRGINHPVLNRRTNKVEITVQNHGFCVDPDSLKDSAVDITHWNLNDDTVEGLRHRSEPLFCVQYHPEAAPGPHDSQYLFDDFAALMREFKKS